MERQNKNMGETISVKSNDVEVVDTKEYYIDAEESFINVPTMARPLLENAKRTFSKIEEMLYSAPAFINAIRASLPEETFQAILSKDQKDQIAKGTLKIMTKKDGSLMANLVNPNTKKIVSTVSLKSVKVTPEITQAMTSYATQMQIAQIAEQIQVVQLAVEEVRQGQEYDRLSTAYSCQQKLIQAMSLKNPELRQTSLLRIAHDAEDSRNLLMQTQNMNVEFIKTQPETFWGKMVSGATPEKINSRINEIRESLCAVNMTSLAEALAYQEMGEEDAARISLEYYSDYIKKTYLESKGFVERLDMIDPAPENYWSTTLPDIQKRIQELPCNNTELLTGGETDGAETV